MLPCSPSPSRGLLLNPQFLLARLRRAFLQDSPTPVLATLRSPGANFLHASGVQTSGPKGCPDISPAEPIWRQTPNSPTCPLLEQNP